MKREKSLSNLEFGRRTMLSGTASALLFGGSSALAAAAKAPVKTAASRGPRSRLGLQEFMELSRRVTEQETLDPKVGAMILASLAADPKHAAALEVLYARSKSGGAGEKLSVADLAISHSFVKDTFQEILTAWYVGVRDEGGKPVLFTYFDALMFKTLEGVRSIPATCGGALNFWANPPQA